MSASSSALYTLSLLLLLCIQNSALTLSLRYSRGVLHEKWSNNGSIIVMELFKLFVCVIMMSRDEINKAAQERERGKEHVALSVRNIKHTSRIDDSSNSDSEQDHSSPLIPSESPRPLSVPSSDVVIIIARLRFLVSNSYLLMPPAVLYLIQNFLVYTALGNLEAATYSIISQLKVLTAALFSVLLLQRKLHTYQWRALLLLFIGVVLVQSQPDAGDSAQKQKGKNMYLGLTCVVGVSFLSSLSGVYFEKVLKKDSSVSVWDRNIQLGVWGIPAGILWCLWNEGADISSRGFFYGYTSLAFFIIVLNGAGGLLVAFVVREADNIVKNFATTIAILLTSTVSYFLFGDLEITITFLCGAICVALSIFNYNDSMIAIQQPQHIGLNNSGTNNISSNSIEKNIALSPVGNIADRTSPRPEMVLDMNGKKA